MGHGGQALHGILDLLKLLRGVQLQQHSLLNLLHKFSRRLLGTVFITGQKSRLIGTDRRDELWNTEFAKPLQGPIHPHTSIQLMIMNEEPDKMPKAQIFGKPEDKLQEDN